MVVEIDGNTQTINMEIQSLFKKLGLSGSYSDSSVTGNIGNMIRWISSSIKQIDLTSITDLDSPSTTSAAVTVNHLHLKPARWQCLWTINRRWI